MCVILCILANVTIGAFVNKAKNIYDSHSSSIFALIDLIDLICVSIGLSVCPSIQSPLILDVLNCFKDYERCVYVSHHILNFVEKKNRFTMKQHCILPILYCQCNACWCPGDLMSQGTSSHGIYPKAGKFRRQQQKISWLPLSFCQLMKQIHGICSVDGCYLRCYSLGFAGGCQWHWVHKITNFLLVTIVSF